MTIDNTKYPLTRIESSNNADYDESVEIYESIYCNGHTGDRAIMFVSCEEISQEKTDDVNID